MNHEISNHEGNEVKNPSAENYKKIKPESEMTPKEASDFLNTKIHSCADHAELNQDISPIEKANSKEYVNENETRPSDEKNKLLPNIQFEKNGYHYETDDKGSITSAEGQLRIRDADYSRNMENVKKYDGQEYKSTDQKGHLIGHQFGGSDKLENLVPMDAKLNQGDFKKLENTLAKSVKDGADVKLKVEPVYEDNSTRPVEFRVTYSIDGDKDAVVFKNESEAKT